MRFRAGISNAGAFHKFVGSLATLGNVAWVRLSSDDLRFTIIPDTGTQVWAQLSIDTVFETYTIQSATPNNTINLEVPLQPLLRALKSASAPTTTTASIRLTKKEGAPWLVVTITTTSFASNTTTSMPPAEHPHASHDPQDTDPNIPDNIHIPNPALPSHTTERKERETHIALDIPVVVLAAAQVAGLHEPRCREPDCHIYLPPLGQLKSISDRFARLAAGSASSGNAAPGAGRFMSTAPSASSSAKSPKLELAATMHGTLRLSYTSDALSIASEWHGLENPELDAAQVGGEEGLANHPSTRMKMVRPAESDEGEGWAKVRVDSRDWGRVLGVGRVGGRVIGCFCNNHALILYCYMSTPSDDPSGYGGPGPGGQNADGGGGGGGESVLTYYISSVPR